MSINQGYSYSSNNSAMMSTSPFNQQSYYYNSKPMNSNYYASIPFNAYETSPNISNNSSGYASTDSFLFNSMYNSPSVNNSSYTSINVNNHSPYTFSPSLYNNENNYSLPYQQHNQATTTSSPNYLIPFQETNSNSMCSKKTGVKRTRTTNKMQQNEETTQATFDTKYILNEIFKKSDEEEEQPQAKKIKRAYNKKSKQVQAENESAKSLQDVNEFHFSESTYSYLNYNEIQQQSTCTQSNQDFDENAFDDDDEENYSVNSFGERKKRVLTRTQRIAANQRERKRMNIMNQSYMKLRQVLPITTGRKRRKMSRLDIVVGAMEYISYLAELVERDEPCEIKFDIFKNCLYDYD